MNVVEKAVKDISKELGYYLCEKWSRNATCDYCPYTDECGVGSLALELDIREFITDYLAEDKK